MTSNNYEEIGYGHDQLGFAIHIGTKANNIYLVASLNWIPIFVWYVVGHSKYPKKEEIKGRCSVVATGVNYGVASLLNGAKSICNHETNITRIIGARQLLPPFEGEHLEWEQTSWLAPSPSRASP